MVGNNSWSSMVSDSNWGSVVVFNLVNDVLLWSLDVNWYLKFRKLREQQLIIICHTDYQKKDSFSNFQKEKRSFASAYRL